MRKRLQIVVQGSDSVVKKMLDSTHYYRRSPESNMLQTKYYAAVAVTVASILPMSIPKAAQAQFISPYVPKPEQIRPDLYIKQKDGTVYDTTTGNVYRNRKRIRRGNGGSTESYDVPSSMPSGTYRLREKDLFTFTNLNDPQVVAGQYANFSGTYSGKYTLPFIYSLGIPIKGTLTLNQNGNQIFGTLVTEADREAQLQGNVQGSQFVGKLVFNDVCGGEGSVIGDLSPSGDLLTGKYKVADCNGKYGGRYKVKRSDSE
jgi:hypothetical protein